MALEMAEPKQFTVQLDPREAAPYIGAARPQLYFRASDRS
jgi:hypothetical protein